ncbi:MAG TPA: cytochrome c oxidase subunit II [Allosphingosinicella sp.]|uniref:cytochrome c oxidase subunit II n=1 Tax=Allosphingosinicella sp. TaxID=2823234 RepID=UPI002ED8F267
MKTLIKIFAAAAALGLMPAGAAAQEANLAQPKQELAAQPQSAGAPRDQISAQSQASPAQPQEVSDPALATPAAEEPSNSQVAQTMLGAGTKPTPGIGQPDGRMGVQDQFTPIGEEAAWFHNVILMPVITVISIFVLILLLYVVIRYRRAAHPIPSRTTHNTLLEVVWTLVPVLILVVIAVPSIKLLANQYSPPKADLTVKVIGNQWYWNYQYPDHGDFELTSNVLSDADAKKRGEPRLLGVDERMVVPAGATVKLIITSNDVIHAFGVPAFWVKLDAVPGRLNETWFKADKPGVYYGQCYELCGARHAYMPIAVEVVPPAQFAAWVASKGGTMPGGAQRASGDETATSPITNPAATAADVTNTSGGSATETSPEPSNIVNAVGTAPVSTQGATNSKRGDSQ